MKYIEKHRKKQPTYYTLSRSRRYDKDWRTFTDDMHAPIIDSARSFLQPGQRILDIGCGTGQILAALYQQQPTLHLTGIDGSTYMLDEARQRIGMHARLVQSHITQGSDIMAIVGSERFDSIVATNVLHYFADPRDILHTLTQLLIPHGTILLTDFIVHGWWWPLVEQAIRVIDPEHHATLADQQLQAIVRAAQLSIDKTVPIRVNRLWQGICIVAHKDI